MADAMRVNANGAPASRRHSKITFALLVSIAVFACSYSTVSAAEPDAATATTWHKRFQNWNTLYKSGNYAEAEKGLLGGMKEAEDNPTLRKAYLPTILNSLITVYYKQNKLKEAEPMFNKYLVLMAATNGANSPEMAQGLQNYASLLKRIDRQEDAKMVEQRAQSILAVIASQPQQASSDDMTWGDTNSGGTKTAPQMKQHSNPPAQRHEEEEESSSDSGVREITEAEFSNEVLMSNEPAIVDFYATWCGPCRRMHPIMKELSKRFVGRAKFYKIDTDKNENLSAQLRIRSLPTFIIFKQGKPVALTVGGRSAEDMSAWISGAI